MFQILREQDVDVLRQGVLRVLERVGFNIDNREILQALKSAGAKVDFDEHTVRFPQSMTETFVAGVQGEDKQEWAAKIAAMGENAKTVLSGWVPYEKTPDLRAPYPPHLFHQLATFYYDDEKQEKRKGNREDYIQLIRFGDMLHPEDGSGHSLNLTEVPSDVEPLEAALCQLEYSHRPRGVYVHDVRQIDYLLEIEEIFGIDDPYWHWMANICPNSPMKLDKTVAERFVHMIRGGRYPAKLAAMPVSGVNMPVTTGGASVIIAAEFLALWMAARAIEPGVPLTGLIVSGTMDMHGGQVSFGAHDALRCRLASAEFLRAWTGIAVSPSIGEWTPASRTGMFAALEKAQAAMTVAAFTGHHPEIGLGHLDSGLTISPVQFLIERELTDSLRFFEHRPMDEASLGLESIEAVGFGLDSNYMEEDHTISHLRQESWMPEFYGRNGWTPEEDQAVKDKALAKVKELVAAHRKPDGREDQLAAAKAVVARAKRELGAH
ncbi:MAG: trimethylamine methyltransferase family protein [Lentisphaeria bacterium]|nr:trimethylamine methyltransferase family protein [Lentisphaeria bacterium]